MSERHSKRHKILVTDDNLAIRIMLEDILSEAGYSVKIASDGEEAIEILGKNDFDLLILDLLMPKKSGFEVLDYLSAEKGRKPLVLVLTGIFKSQKEIDRLRKLGAKGYIYKSAPIEEILYRVNMVLFPTEKNTRNSPRIPISIAVDYKHDGEWFTTYTATLSSGGMFLRTVNIFKEGTELFMKFVLPEVNRTISTEGKVIWSNEYSPESRKRSLPGMGVIFKNLPDATQGTLDSFITKKISSDLMW